jgi:hypothetical protein
MKTRTILAAIAGALLCAQMFAADNGPKAKIVVYYSAYNFGMNPVINISIVKPEGQQGIALHANRYCQFVVPAGRYTLIRRSMGNQEPIEVYIKSGETVYVECHVGFAHWNFEVSEDQAHAKLRVSHLKLICLRKRGQDIV